MMVSLTAECHTLSSLFMFGFRMCVDGVVPWGMCGMPSSKIAILALSCAPASEMREPSPFISIAAGDCLPKRFAKAAQELS